MALVVCLSLIVLITAAVLAFFARATANRVVEASRANRVEMEQLAKTAEDYITSGFLREIATNSTTATSNGVVIYQPTTNTFAVPQRPLPALLASDTNFANLIRRSIDETTNGIGETNASAHSTAAASRNGRSVGTSRWNAPMLLSGTGFNDTNQLPNWIYVNGDGSVTGTPTTNSTGRFAYNVYDTGGLLDANVAGYPSGISGTNLATLKGSLAGADLSVIPGITDAFIQWRNTNSAGSASSYVTTVTNAATNGFLRAAPGDNRITSRQDLIKLAKNGALGTNALPFLTHFSRAVNAPSWMPPQNASDIPRYSASLETISPASAKNYKDNADSPASVNRNIPNVRVSTAFTRRDGTPAKVGEPLIAQRFPLNKLALVRNGSTDPEIMSYFGLTWNAGENGWDYIADTINTLDQVAAAGREPNFFELLKAGILDGSLGKSTAVETGIVNKAIDAKKDLQILTIGANLIDQADADDQPTHIVRSITSEDVFGIENHPYIYMISQTHFRRHDMDYDPLNIQNPQPWITAFQQFQVWNPNLNAAGRLGRDYRIRALSGTSRTTAHQVNLEPKPQPFVWRFSSPVDQTGRFISFNGTLDCKNPVLLTPDNISSASPENSHTVLGASLIGFHFGDVEAPNNTDGDNNPNNDYGQSNVSSDVAIVYQLEYSDGGSFIPIQRIYPFRATGMGHGMGDNLTSYTNGIYSGQRNMTLTWTKSDPRCQRFGFYATAAGGALNNSTMRADTTAYYNSWGFSVANPGWKITYPLPVPNSNTGYTPGDFADNRTDSPSYVADPDGVVRPADGTRATNILGAGSQARPVVLNRPLTSVGEIGYAMRGDPWKSLDFASKSSADSALADLFCVMATPATQSGVVNPNEAPSEVLQALLLDADIDPVVAASHLSSASAIAIATKIRAYVGTNALANRADLIRMGEDLGAITGLDHKRQKEVVVRALINVSNTRTWNLMADVVTQAGSFPASSTSADAFIVKGELRMWTHLAIDRPTNKVISQSSEPCLE